MCNTTRYSYNHFMSLLSVNLYANRTIVGLECNSVIEATDDFRLIILHHNLIDHQVSIKAIPTSPKRTRLCVSRGLHIFATFPQSGSATFVKPDFAIDNDTIQSSSGDQVTVKRADQMVGQRTHKPFLLKLQPGIISWGLWDDRVSVNDNGRRGLYLFSKLRGISFNIGKLWLVVAGGVVQKI